MGKFGGRFIAAVALVLVLGIGLWFAKSRRNHNRPAIRIGVILARTGPAQFIGEPEWNVLKALDSLFRTDPHAPAVTLELKDSHGDVQQARNIFDSFVRDSTIIAVIGPSTSGESIALAGLADSLRIPLLSLAASKHIVIDTLETVTRQTRRYVFKFAQNDDLAAQALIGAIIRSGDSLVAFLSSNDGFGRSGASVFTQALRDYGHLRLVASSQFDPEPDHPELIVRNVPKSAQAIVIWGTSPGPARIVQELRRSGNTGQIYLSHGNASESFIKATGGSAEGAIVIGSRILIPSSYLSNTSNRDSVLTSFHSFWERRFSGLPSHFGGHARDALESIVTVIQAGAPPTRDGLRDGLERLTQFNGVTGTFSFSPTDHAGLDSSAFAVFVIENGRFVPKAW